MINSKIQGAFNEQINAELFSSYLYLSIVAWFESQGFKGMGTWMRYQAQEEHAHAMKFFDYIAERSGEITLTEIATPKKQWNSPLEAFEDAYKHEQMISGRCNDLMNLALSEKDHAAASFCRWFVDEQVEEEASVLEIVDKLKLVGDNGVALFMIDGELGQRPAPAAAPTAT